MFTFSPIVSFYKNPFFILRLEALTLISFYLPLIASRSFSLFSFSLFLLFAQTVTMVKTRGGGSSKKRVGADFKAASSASKWLRKDSSPSPLPAKPLVASSIATEATKPTPLPAPMGMRQKAQAIKPTKDESYYLWVHL